MKAKAEVMEDSSPATSERPGLRLRLHQFWPESRANGPGRRAVIWVQGCSLGCRGCFNPDTHAPEGGYEMAVEDLLVSVVELEGQIEGITLSGGEPLEQAPALASFLERVKAQTRLSVLLFSGFTWEEIQQDPERRALLPWIDVLVAGRYLERQHLGRGLRGSANQTIELLTSRYRLADLRAVPPAELIVHPGGDCLVSGTDPPAR